MRKRKEIRAALVTLLESSANLTDITAYRVYPHWRDNVPVINIITGAETIDDDGGILNGYVMRNMDLIFEIITDEDTGGDLIDDYDMEIEELLATEGNVVDLITTSGKPTVHSLWPSAFDEPEFLSEGDAPIIRTRIHWACKYIEALGGES